MRKFFLQLKMTVFHSSRYHSQNTVDIFWFHQSAWHCDVITSRHDVTKFILAIAACRCARNMIFFCFYDILGCWVQKCGRFCICLMTSRHDVMAWRQKHAVHISACRLDRKVIIFVVSIVFRLAELKNVFASGFWWCHDVMTWRHDVTKLTSPISVRRCSKW